MLRNESCQFELRIPNPIAVPSSYLLALDVKPLIFRDILSLAPIQIPAKALTHCIDRYSSHSIDLAPLMSLPTQCRSFHSPSNSYLWLQLIQLLGAEWEWKNLLTAELHLRLKNLAAFRRPRTGSCLRHTRKERESSTTAAE